MGIEEAPKEKSWWQDWGNTVDVFDLRPRPPKDPAPEEVPTGEPITYIAPKIYDFIMFSSTTTDIYYVRS